MSRPWRKVPDKPGPRPRRSGRYRRRARRGSGCPARRGSLHRSAPRDRRRGCAPSRQALRGTGCWDEPAGTARVPTCRGRVQARPWRLRRDSAPRPGDGLLPRSRIGRAPRRSRAARDRRSSCSRRCRESPIRARAGAPDRSRNRGTECRNGRSASSGWDSSAGGRGRSWMPMREKPVQLGFQV